LFAATEAPAGAAFPAGGHLDGGEDGDIVVVAENVRDAPLFRRLHGADGAAADGGDLDAEAPQGFEMSGACKTGADDA